MKNRNLSFRDAVENGNAIGFADYVKARNHGTNIMC
jgi:hypothetical protein